MDVKRWLVQLYFATSLKGTASLTKNHEDVVLRDGQRKIRDPFW
jgi:hypothetical protein